MLTAAERPLSPFMAIVISLVEALNPALVDHKQKEPLSIVAQFFRHSICEISRKYRKFKHSQTVILESFQSDIFFIHSFAIFI